MEGYRRAAGGGNYISAVTLQIFKNDELVFDQTADASRNAGGNGTISFVTPINLTQGDKVTIVRGSNVRKIVRGTVNGSIT
jgi:hypothetical protein